MTDGPPPSVPSPLPPGQRREAALRVVHYGRVPRIDLASWRLIVHGATADGAEHALSWTDIEAMPHARRVVDLHCVSRRSTPALRWGGVPARELLAKVPPDPDAHWVLASAVFGYSANITRDDLEHPDALLATELNDAPLEPAHGWPLRLVLPHLYAWKGPKWLVDLEYLTEPRRGFWESQGYHFTGDVLREQRYAHQE